MAESALIIVTLLTLGEFLLIDISFFVSSVATVFYKCDKVIWKNSGGIFFSFNF